MTCPYCNGPAHPEVPSKKPTMARWSDLVVCIRTLVRRCEITDAENLELRKRIEQLEAKA